MSHVVLDGTRQQEQVVGPRLVQQSGDATQWPQERRAQNAAGRRVQLERVETKRLGQYRVCARESAHGDHVELRQVDDGPAQDRPGALPQRRDSLRQCGRNGT